MQKLIKICEDGKSNLYKKDRAKERLRYLDTLTHFKSVKTIYC